MKDIRLMGRITEELFLAGSHQCSYKFLGGAEFLTTVVWIFASVWEVLALCLAGWSAVKHFRELQRPWTGWSIGDCFTVLITSHALYFAA